MKSALGILAIAIGAGAAIIAITSLLLGLRRGDDRLLAAGRRGITVVVIASIAAVAVMEWALVTHDFSIRYVAENNARSTPLLFTITGLWAALEGSILLWLLVLTLLTVGVVVKYRDRLGDPMVGWALAVLFAVGVFFFVLTLGPANPFAAGSPGVLDGPGPNPLLQNHILVMFHPPVLYIGYVGFTVPFAFAIGALVTGRVGEGWLLETRRWALLSWGLLTFGIILGSW